VPMKVVGIIPARLASTRLPEKPLVKLCGKPMIEHVYRRSLLAKEIDDLYIATCDEKIAEVVRGFGGKVVMTSPSHKRGTERVQEAASSIDADIFINIQGDEPMVTPEPLDEAIIMMKKKVEIGCVNMVSLIKDWDAFNDPNVVKTVVDDKFRILYFSRLPIPSVKKETFQFAYRQIGIYLFRKKLLMDFVRWGESRLEISESVDMLRFLENGVQIQAFVSDDLRGVDTPEDACQVEKVLLNDPLFSKVFPEINPKKTLPSGSGV